MYFLTGVLNLVLAIPLGMKYGGIGCAVATGFSMLMGNGVVMNYFYKKYIGLDIPQFWKQIGRISLSVELCLVVGYGVDHMVPGSGKFVFLLKILGYMVLYGVMVYFTAMSPEEKEKVRGIGRKVRVKP